MQLNHTRADGKLVVRFMGELGHHEAMETVRYLENVIDLYTPVCLELDLSEMSFMDSSGIAVIMSAYRNLRDIGSRFQVTHVPAQAKKVLSAAGVDKIIKII